MWDDDLDEDDDEWDDNDVDEVEVEEDKDQVVESESFSEDEFGEFAQNLYEIQDWNNRLKTAQRDGENGWLMSQEPGVDVEAVKDEIKRVLAAREELAEKQRGFPAESASAWLLQEKQFERERKLRQKLSLLAVGMTSQMLYGVADEYDDLIQNAW